jgi:hypothetical protein
MLKDTFPANAQLCSKFFSIHGWLGENARHVNAARKITQSFGVNARQFESIQVGLPFATSAGVL